MEVVERDFEKVAREILRNTSKGFDLEDSCTYFSSDDPDIRLKKKRYLIFPGYKIGYIHVQDERHGRKIEFHVRDNNYLSEIVNWAKEVEIDLAKENLQFFKAEVSVHKDW